MLRDSFALMATVAMFSILMLTSCGTDSDPSTGSLEVRLHDTPIDSAEEVNVSINRVEINETGSENGWTTINSPNTTYNLLDLTNGAYEVLGDTTMPTGTYQQIRLILNETGHSVVVDGIEHDMIVPSGTETGIKLNVLVEIEENIDYVLLLDFDAAKSVVEAGNEQSGAKYLLKPVIQAKNEAATGAIAGTVTPAEAIPMIHAIQSSDTLTTSIADTSSGEFVLMGLDQGTYTIAFEPRNESYQPADTTGVVVTIGETNDLGSIELQAQ